MQVEEGRVRVQELQRPNFYRRMELIPGTLLFSKY